MLAEAAVPEAVVLEAVVPEAAATEVVVCLRPRRIRKVGVEELARLLSGAPGFGAAPVVCNYKQPIVLGSGSEGFVVLVRRRTHTLLIAFNFGPFQYAI